MRKRALKHTIMIKLYQHLWKPKGASITDRLPLWVVVFSSILTAWWVENRQCSRGIEQNNLPIWKRLGDLRATLASEGLIFSHRPSIITENGQKWTKIFLSKEQKNTYRSSLRKTDVCWFNGTVSRIYCVWMQIDFQGASTSMPVLKK